MVLPADSRQRDQTREGPCSCGGTRQHRAHQMLPGWTCPETGSGSVLAVALIASVLMLTGLALPLNAAFTARQLAANAADAAALAAADTASGLVPGYPCDNAGEAAWLNGALLASCALDGVEATVTVTRTVLGVVISVGARAGPPPDG